MGDNVYKLMPIRLVREQVSRRIVDELGGIIDRKDPRYSRHVRPFMQSAIIFPIMTLGMYKNRCVIRANSPHISSKTQRDIIFAYNTFSRGIVHAFVGKIEVIADTMNLIMASNMSVLDVLNDGMNKYYVTSAFSLTSAVRANTITAYMTAVKNTLDHALEHYKRAYLISIGAN